MARFTADRKGVYHSEFVMAAERGGPVAIQLTGKIITNVKKGLGTVYFKEVDEQLEHYYTLENAYMLELFQKLPRGEILHVTMTGNKDDTEHQAAIISVSGQTIASANWNGGGVAPAPQAPPPAQRQAPPPPQQNRQQPPQERPVSQRHPGDEPLRQQSPPTELTDYRAGSVQAQWAEALKAAHDVLHYAIHNHDVFPLFTAFDRNLTPDALLTKTCEVATGMVITQNTRAGMLPMRAPRESNNGNR